MQHPVRDDGWQATAVDGVLRRSTRELADDRGSFVELWRASQTAPLGEGDMAQINVSRSRAGVLRGMHFHLRQADLWILLDGEAWAATTDLRPAITGGAPISQVVRMFRGDALFIPSRVAHGFLAVTDMALLYLVSNEYDGSDELGFAWDDPDAAIEWPAQPTSMSGRDRDNPSLSRVIEGLNSGRR